MKIFSARFVSKLLSLFTLLTLCAAARADQITATVGQAVEIQVTADGTQPFTYQWYKNGTAISGATGSSLTFSSVTAGDAGSYTATVANIMGSTTSDAAVLTVQGPATPPTITSQPASVTVTANQSATFSVTATATSGSALTYQWRKGTTNISGATSASYTIARTAVGDAGSYSVVVTADGLSTTSSTATLTVNAATAITQQPASLSVISGQAASFTVVATGSGTLAYQWKKGSANISGATSATYTIASTSSSDAASYSVTVTGAGGSVTSNTATLTVNPAPVATAPDGYASLVTGGGTGSPVTVTTAADFVTAVTADAARVITVSGAITLPGNVVSVKSNKTIQGANDASGIVGQLDLNGVNNVIIRGLNISNANGNGITLRNGTSSVFISHCSIFDCAGSLIEIGSGSDYVTVSWSEFYYSSTALTNRKALTIGVAGSESKPLHVTMHHNWFSDLCVQDMPGGNYGYVHLYNNYFGARTATSALGNTNGTLAGDNAQFLAERNCYNRVTNPLSKQGTGRICAIANADTTGTAYTTRDSVFTPTYSYEMTLQDDVDAVIPSLVGNVSGAGSTHPTSATATVNGPSSAVSPGSSFTLTAVPVGFTGASYQWRRNNLDISGATSSTYMAAMQGANNAGSYTVVIGMPSSSSVVVSAPLDVALGADTGGDGGSSSSSGGGGVKAAASTGGGGGGAPGHVYLAGLALLGLVRLISRRRRAA